MHACKKVFLVDLHSGMLPYQQIYVIADICNRLVFQWWSFMNMFLFSCARPLGMFNFFHFTTSSSRFSEFISSCLSLLWSCSLLKQGPTPWNRRYDNVLLGQGCRTPRGAVVGW
jgi:hypothetical protein